MIEDGSMQRAPNNLCSASAEDTLPVSSQVHSTCRSSLLKWQISARCLLISAHQGILKPGQDLQW